jgi:hypothetical protein
MFADAATLDERQVTSSIKKELKKWFEAEDTWFDDRNYIAGVESVDKRVAHATRIINIARRIASRNSSGEYLQVVSGLEEQRVSLASLRDDLLNGVSGRQDDAVLASLRPTKLATAEEARWVELEAGKFFRENSDAPSRYELAERAKRFAELHLGGLTREAFQRVASAFIYRVDVLGRSAPRRTAGVQPIRQSFKDSLLFLE